MIKLKDWKKKWVKLSLISLGILIILFFGSAAIVGAYEAITIDWPQIKKSTSEQTP